MQSGVCTKIVISCGFSTGGILLHILSCLVLCIVSHLTESCCFLSYLPKFVLSTFPSIVCFPIIVFSCTSFLGLLYVFISYLTFFSYSNFLYLLLAHLFLSDLNLPYRCLSYVLLFYLYFCCLSIHPKT